MCPGENGYTACGSVKGARSLSQKQDHQNNLGDPEQEDHDLPSNLGNVVSRLDVAREVDICSFIVQHLFTFLLVTTS